MSSKQRQIVLLSVLGLMLVALAYDFLVARPKCDQAHKLVAAMAEKNATQAGGLTVTDAEVQEKLGPYAQRENRGNYVIDTHIFRGGLIFRTYNVKAVYVNRKGKLYLQHAFQNQEVEDWATPTVELAVDASNVPPPTDGQSVSGPPGAASEPQTAADPKAAEEPKPADPKSTEEPKSAEPKPTEPEGK